MFLVATFLLKSVCILPIKNSWIHTRTWTPYFYICVIVYDILQILLSLQDISSDSTPWSLWNSSRLLK